MSRSQWPLFPAQPVLARRTARRISHGKAEWTIHDAETAPGAPGTRSAHGWNVIQLTLLRGLSAARSARRGG
jgi:hypothetical protein